MAKNTTSRGAKSSKSAHDNKAKIAAGVGLAAVAAAAAGAYFLYGTEAGKKKRHEIKSWSLRMKADVMDSMSKMKDWSEASYHTALQDIGKKYEGMKNVEASEVKALVQSLKKHWKDIKKEVEGVTKKGSAKKKAQ